MNTPIDPKTAEASASQLPAITQPNRQEVRVVSDPIPVIDTAKFEQMQRVANVMAWSSYLPDALCKTKGKDDKGKDVMIPLDSREIMSNCFMVVNQATRWGMDPFAVAQCVSVVHGKLCYEGKLIAGLIDAKLGIRLHYDWSGEGENMKVTVSGTFPDGTTESIEGTVKDWKTTRPGSPWTLAQYRKMLAYRGAREWGRLYAPGLMLGIYTPDEMDVLTDGSRATRARDVTTRAADPDDDMPPAPPPRQIPQEAPPTATVTDSAPTEPPVDTSFVELAASSGAPTTPPEDDNPPDPASRPEAGQSRPGETGKASPAAAPAIPKQAAGEVFSSKDRLIASLAELKTAADYDAWIDQYGRDMAELDGADLRAVESACNIREGELRNPKKK